MSILSGPPRRDYYCDYINTSVKNGLTKPQFPVCLFKIVALFADDCNNQITELHIHMNNLWIKGYYRNHMNELMLRLGGNLPGTGLVIARVQFIHKRCGNFTKLVDILDDIRMQYDLGETMIESAISDEMKSWIQKNGWMVYKYQDNYVSPDAYYRLCDLDFIKEEDDD